MQSGRRFSFLLRLNLFRSTHIEIGNQVLLLASALALTNLHSPMTLWLPGSAFHGIKSTIFALGCECL